MTRSSKRLVVRLSLVAVVVTLGIIAIAQAQRKGGNPEGEAESQPAAPKTASRETPQPIPLEPDEQQVAGAARPSATDPFSSSRLARFSSETTTVVRGNNDPPGYGDQDPEEPPTSLRASGGYQGIRYDDQDDAPADQFPLRPQPLAADEPTDQQAADRPTDRPQEDRFAADEESDSRAALRGPGTLRPPSQPAYLGDQEADVEGPPAHLPPPKDQPDALRAPRGEEHFPIREYQATRFETEQDGYAPDQEDASTPGQDDAPDQDQDAPGELPATEQDDDVQEHEQAGADDLADGDTAEPASIVGTGTPGARQSEGLQTPTLSIEKIAPAEIQVDRPATFQIKVRNVGQVPAHDVTVVDQVPQGTSLIDASPPFETSPDGMLVWQLGTLQPGAESTLAMELLPQQEGEVGSVAQVMFQAQASVRTQCTQPQLRIEHSAPPQVLIGQDITLAITISNTGTGAATNVLLEEDVPEGLSHPAGSQLEYEVGTLKPGDSKRLDLTLKAVKAGPVENLLVLRADGKQVAEDLVTLEVTAPELQLALDGPSKRYLQREATYTISVTNPGTARANEIELTAYLPKGLKFVSANNLGHYDDQAHAIYWSLTDLAPDSNGTVQLTALPVETGQQKVRVEGRAELGLTDTFEHLVQVDSLSELLFTVADLADPIEVGSETTYEVRLSNNGSKTDTNVRLMLELPPGLKPLSGEGPTRPTVDGQQVAFDPVPRLGPQDEVRFKVQARGTEPGDHRVRVQVSSDEVRTPIAKEESTRVYRDE